MNAAPVIRPATPADVPAIAAIFGHHVVHGEASFETVPPGESEMAARLARLTGAGHPWLVAELDGDVAGYAYAAPYHAREAYRFTCEDSIYLRHDRQGRGLGKALLAALIEAAATSGFRQMIALITAGEGASIPLHTRLGFVEVGRTHAVGRKHGRWLDVVTMQRALGPGSATPPPVEP